MGSFDQGARAPAFTASASVFTPSGPAGQRSGADPQTPEWVGFKWLMGACGQRVCIDRLQSDRPYALACLDQALLSGHPQLAQYASGLRRRLDCSA